MGKRENVWLGVAGVVISEDGRWLVVKKRYGGLKGSWSLPAGFVDEGETADQAVLREVYEETGIECTVAGLLGLRTGVIRESISDNMLVFLLAPLTDQKVKVEESELYDARFILPEQLKADPATSLLLHYLLSKPINQVVPGQVGLNPGEQFHYSAYQLFL
ncbi:MULTISPECIES: NUDIX hydrolase [unclassified Bacillus (in: firmicutes)]|uniref:NUDIX domain-containing protein n=1 Tax=unclassified Bacillus (in: firmicutes) TaxID=185979 RepID=UPI001BE74658|nr:MULTISPECIES: NUDIX hydrolase [unclassified Bacillus (in: firmicutes)]MBT2638103.1 NUDIX hydrolase [Bacillus sp. ISL-39]MBT2659452.1 NUDIX hydrolase [Bacillus sp. ISL-45]